jgi:hypothetical protein
MMLYVLSYKGRKGGFMFNTLDLFLVAIFTAIMTLIAVYLVGGFV